MATMDNLKEQIKGAIKKLYDVDDVTVDFAEVPSNIAGDYSTNVAMRLARQAGKNPRQIAEEIIAELKEVSEFEFSIAGPGFINIGVSGKALKAQLDAAWSEHYGDNDSGAKKLPQTGVNYTWIIAIAVLSVSAIVSFVSYKKFKNI